MFQVRRTYFHNIHCSCLLWDTVPQFPAVSVKCHDSWDTFTRSLNMCYNTFNDVTPTAQEIFIVRWKLEWNKSQCRRKGNRDVDMFARRNECRSVPSSRRKSGTSVWYLAFLLLPQETRLIPFSVWGRIYLQMLRDADNSPSFRAEVRNAWSFTSMLVSWTGAVTEGQCYLDEYVTMGLSFTSSNFI
jgi:hypothetical protein